MQNIKKGAWFRFFGVIHNGYEVSFVLCLVMLFGYVAMIPAEQIQVRAATTNQNNIVARANYLYNATWVCQKTVSGWRGNYTFTKGNTYHLPYGQPVYAGAYIGFGVSVDDFLAARVIVPVCWRIASARSAPRRRMIPRRKDSLWLRPLPFTDTTPSSTSPA